MTRDELLRAWVNALESGKYEQGRDALRTHDTFCCLGVLCDLNDARGWRALIGIPGAYAYRDRAGEWEQTAILPYALMTRTGLTGDQQCTLTKANDSGAPFSEIAQLLRDWFPDVFVTAEV